MFLEFLVLICIAIAFLMRGMRYLLQKSLKGTEPLNRAQVSFSVFASFASQSNFHVFSIAGDVVLITGGASGIGYLVRHVHWRPNTKQQSMSTN